MAILQNYILTLKLHSNYVLTLVISLSVLYNYFDGSNKIIFKFEFSFFPYTKHQCQTYSELFLMQRKTQVGIIMPNLYRSVT